MLLLQLILIALIKLKRRHKRLGDLAGRWTMIGRAQMFVLDQTCSLGSSVGSSFMGSVFFALIWTFCAVSSLSLCFYQLAHVSCFIGSLVLFHAFSVCPSGLWEPRCSSVSVAFRTRVSTLISSPTILCWCSSTHHSRCATSLASAVTLALAAVLPDPCLVCLKISDVSKPADSRSRAQLFWSGTFYGVGSTVFCSAGLLFQFYRLQHRQFCCLKPPHSDSRTF